MSKIEKGRLVKITDEKFDGNHPNKIYVGYIEEGYIWQHPVVGKGCAVNDLFTSVVEEILSENKKEIIFRTKNSKYKLEILT